MNRIDFQILELLQYQLLLTSGSVQLQNPPKPELIPYLIILIPTSTVTIHKACPHAEQGGKAEIYLLKYQWLINHMFISLWKNTSNTKQFQPEHSMPNQILIWKDNFCQVLCPKKLYKLEKWKQLPSFHENPESWAPRNRMFLLTSSNRGEEQ